MGNGTDILPRKVGDEEFQYPMGNGTKNLSLANEMEDDVSIPYGKWNP